MIQQSTTAFLLLSLLTSIALATNKITLKERILPPNEITADQTNFGSSSFLLGFILHGHLNQNEPTLSSNEYNPIHFILVKEKKTKELEVLVTYMKTYQKDLTLACKMAMTAALKILSRPELLFYKQRCVFWGDTVFKYLPMSMKLYNIEHALKYFYFLQKAKGISINKSLRESLDEADIEEIEDLEEREIELKRFAEAEERNQIFFDTLGNAINNVLLEKEDIALLKFNLIQRFYGPNFAGIFYKTILDDEYRLSRKEIQLSISEQSILDALFNTPD